MNASTGMRKPPIAPKPKLLQSQKLVVPPLIAQRDGLVQQTPDSPARVKPVLAPKPCLSKLTAAGGRSPVTPKSLYHSSPAVTTKTVGILNSKNGLQQENKRPNWDYIIPICLCSNPNCMCIRSTHSAHIDKTVKDLKADKTGDLTKTSGRDDGDRKTNAKSHVENTTSTRSHTTNLDPKLKTNIDTSSGVHFSPSAPEEDAFIPDTVSEPKMASRVSKKPVPSPRTLKKTSLTRQEKVVDEEEEMTGQSGGQKEEETVSPQDNERVCSSVRLSAFLPAKKSCLPPAPPPKKKLFLSTSEQTPASAISAVSSDVVEEDLGWDSSLYEMEVSVDKDEELSTEGKEEKNGYGDLGCSSGGLPDLNVAQTRPQRRSSPMAWTQQTKETDPRGRGGEKTEQDCVFKERVMRELPLPPCEKPRGREDAGTSQRSRSGFGKQRPKSFSGADLTPLGGQRTNSFRKLLDLKLSVLQRFRGKGVPEFPVTHSTGPVRPCSYPEQLRPERKYSCPLIGVEQSVDGDEFPFSAEDDYENMPLYEEIQDYVNMPVGMEVTSPLISAWPRRTYDDDDEGIYEEQEPYMSLQKTTAHQHGDETCDSNSKPAELAVGHEGPSDDDTIDQTSDEGDDSSSVSSKGETEQIVTPNRPKKSKIQHIATEIMTSERVFVDVLKLLHIDFRDAVSKASQQSGKPVIEDRLLNQILYSLPQLYELNQDLLRELQIRVAKWDENSQLADIFLKKGPYLKMYSTYVREFDKNVALLEEQTKKNPAFGAAVRGFEASPRCANLALRHYLLKPVQRIPQYQLLLTDYLKNLPEDSVDYKDTEAALHIVKEVANHANDIMKQGDNFQKMIQVQCRLTGHHEIIQPGRLFLKEGTLKKLSRKVMQPRMFFLFNDTLLYTTPVQSGQYKLNNMLSLAGMKVSKPSQEAYQNELNIESVERSFILSASSATERDEWLEAISTAISEYTKKKITFISGKISEQMEFKESGDGYNLGSKAPIWIPDPRATMCMICTCEFTLTWRRHHCRGCGKVVCQSCSSNKHCLEYLKNQLARVCDQCFLVLRQQKSEASESASLSPNKAGFSFRKQKKIPAALKEVTANTDNSSISGYLQRSKGNKKNWKRLWFVIKNKVLYTYAASEDVAALESQPLLGFRLKEDSAQQLQFSLYHKNTLYYTFKADEIQVAQRWIEAFKESTVL